MPRKPAVKLPENLNIVATKATEFTPTGSKGDSNNPFIPSVKESYDNGGTIYHVIVEPDLVNPTRNAIRNAAAVVNCGVRTNCIEGEGKGGKAVVKIEYKAGAKRNVKPRKSKTHDSVTGDPLPKGESK